MLGQSQHDGIIYQARDSEVSRYSENGAEAWSDPDSITEFEMACYSDWIIIRSLKHGFGAIY